ncbi:MAG: ribonuclease III [Phycisphaeraceae bacterium]
MIEQVQELLGYRFENPELLKESLTHASLADHRLQSNERLEFLGDSVLGYVVCEYLFRCYPELHEGDMTKIKSAVVSRRACAKVSRALGLDDFVSLGKGMSGRPTLPSSVAAAVVESVIAAIYLDGGIEPARAFILEHMVPLIEAAAESAHHHNYKSALQQHAQQTSPHHPVYILLDEKGPDHAKCFEVCVEIDGRRYPSAWANAKKEAEQRAAYNAMVELGELGDADDVDADEPVEERERRELAAIKHAVDETAPG